MEVTFPDRHTIETVLSLATRAPSIHNSQPWRWCVGADHIELHADPERALPRQIRTRATCCSAAGPRCIMP